MWTLESVGIEPKAVDQYIAEQIYTLPGVEHPEEQFSIVLTGSRSVGVHTPESDVDLEVLCPQSVYDAVHCAAMAAGIIRTPRSFLVMAPGPDWQRYFGPRMSRPHFSLQPLERLQRQFARYEDVPLWIYTNAKILRDPCDRFGALRSVFRAYPRDVLVQKIKYRWMLAAYWEIEVYPFHHKTDDELSAACMAIANAVAELQRLFFLVEGCPFPYPEKLARLAGTTRLGAQFCPMLQRVVDLAVGAQQSGADAWERLDAAIRLLCFSDESEECRRLEQTCAQAMLAAGVEPAWVKADFANIDELFAGELGPVP